MSTAVRLVEVDDEIAMQLRDGAAVTRPLAVGFPRTEDLEALDARERGALAFLVVDGDGIVVGTCGTHGPPEPTGTVELGWGLVESARGMGIGGATVVLLVDEVRRRDPHSTLIARTEWVGAGSSLAADSPASEAILVRQGFHAAPVPPKAGTRAWTLSPASP